jgi:hypothetical protein
MHTSDVAFQRERKKICPKHRNLRSTEQNGEESNLYEGHPNEEANVGLLVNPLGDISTIVRVHDGKQTENTELRSKEIGQRLNDNLSEHGQRAWSASIMSPLHCLPLATIFRILTPKNFGLRAFLKEIPTRSIIVERQMDSALSPIVMGIILRGARVRSPYVGIAFGPSFI